jgi:hypothetical protein
MKTRARLSTPEFAHSCGQSPFEGHSRTLAQPDVRALDAPITTAFGFRDVNLFAASGSFNDPDLRAYDSWGYGQVSPIEWSA